MDTLRSLLGMSAQLIQHTGEIAHHITVPEPKDRVSASVQVSSAVFDVLPLSTMLPSIQFDDHALISTAEINYVRANRILPVESITVELSVPQSPPGQSFSVSLGCSKLPRSNCGKA